MKPHSRSAFTLFQLLLVLAIFGIGLSLFLPALAKLKQTAARTQSANNLKQIGLAAHGYYDANGQFPAGCDANNFSAAAYLLPYIEQGNLFNTIDFKKPVDANATAAAAVVKTFLDPQDPVVQANKKFGATNYLFNAGSKADLKDNDGVFYLESKTKFPDITDGTSNTILAGETLKGDGGEKAIDVKRQHVLLKKDALKGIKDDAGVKDFKDDKNIAGDRCASWMDGRFLQGTFNTRLGINDDKPDVTCAGAGGVSGLRTPNDGTNVLMCDASVRFVSSKVKLATWRAASTRNGGEVLGPDF